MECGTKITPCGGAAWGSERVKNTRLKSATAPRERRAGKTSNASGGCAFQARRRCGASPKRALPRAWGYACFAPSGRGKSLKLKGKFLREGFSEKAAGKRSVKPCRLSPLKLSLTSFDFAVFLCVLASWREISADGFRGQAGRLPSVFPFLRSSVLKEKLKG